MKWLFPYLTWEFNMSCKICAECASQGIHKIFFALFCHPARSILFYRTFHREARSSFVKPDLASAAL